jgi:hypothetical protein
MTNRERVETDRLADAASEETQKAIPLDNDRKLACVPSVRHLSTPEQPPPESDDCSPLEQVPLLVPLSRVVKKLAPWPDVGVNPNPLHTKNYFDTREPARAVDRRPISKRGKKNTVCVLVCVIETVKR